MQVVRRQAAPKEAAEPEDQTVAVVEKLKTPVVLKRKAEGMSLLVPIAREDIVEAVSRQLRVAIDPEILDIGSEQLKEVGEFLLPLKIVDPEDRRLQLEVHVSAT